MIDLFDDFRDILVELHNAGARFVVLGGHAVAFHGHPRATKDLDVLVEANPDNCLGYHIHPRVTQPRGSHGEGLQAPE